MRFRPRLHEQIKPPLIAQILGPYEVTPDEFAQIKVVLFAHVNAALMPRTHAANKSILFAQILDPYEITLQEFAQIKHDIFAHVYQA